MSDFGPFEAVLSAYERKDRKIDLVTRNRVGVKKLRLFASKRAMDIYGDPVGAGVTGGTSFGRKEICSVQTGKMYRSQSFRGWQGQAEYSRKGQTSFLLNMLDFLEAPEAAQGHITADAPQAGDTFDLAGVVTFTAIAGVANPANQEFTTLGGDEAVATSIAAAINDAASQALIGVATGGPSITATVMGTRVLLQSDTEGLTGEIALASSNGTRLPVSGVALQIVQPLGPESSVTYFALQEVGASDREWSNGDDFLGPVCVIPNPGFYASQAPMLSLALTAPANLGASAGTTPYETALASGTYGPLAIWLPQGVAQVNIRNGSAAALLYSTGWGNPYASLGTSIQTDLQVAGSRLWVFESASSTPASFTLEISFQHSS